MLDNPDQVVALEILKNLSKEQKLKMCYQARKSLRREASGKWKSAKQRGIDLGMEMGRIEGNIEGMETGLERGRIEGISIGLENGRKYEAKKIAENLLRMGFEPEKIAEATELSLEKVLQLKAALAKLK